MNKEQAGINTGDHHQDQKRKNKVNINTLLNILFFAGLLVLYGLYFIDFEKEPEVEPEAIETIEKAVSDATLKIAFVDTDEFIDHYAFAEELHAGMLSEQRRLESDFSRRQREFQRKVEELQYQLQRGLISMDEAQVKEQELMQEQQELLMLSEEYSERLRQKEYDLKIELFDSVSSIVRRYNEKLGFDFVLNYSSGGGLLLGGDKYDITKDLIEKVEKD